MQHFFVAGLPKLSARPPIGLDNSDGEVDDVVVVGDVMKDIHTAMGERVRFHSFGSDAGGLVYEVGSAYVHTASRDGVHCAWVGEVANWPGHPDIVAEAHNAFIRGDDAMENDNEADWLLSFYSASLDRPFDSIQDATLAALAKVQGSFAFILYDSATHTMWAARDQKGEQEMWWGVSPDGTFMLATHEAALEDLCQPSATPFPAGCMFKSHGTGTLYEPGTWGFVLPNSEALVHPESLLMSFIEGQEGHFRGVKAVPRVNERGVLCGAVYRVASEIQLDKMGRAH